MKETMPKLIAVTGGPCSGKTNLLEHLKTTDIAQKAVFVPEAASLVLPGFLAVKDSVPSHSDSWWQYSLQHAVSRLQLELEDTYREAAMAEGKAYVICDRGLRDAEVYTDETASIYESLGLTAATALMRYHAVIHMESLATAAPQRYGIDNNPHRYEPVVAAGRVEVLTRSAWVGHPRWEFIAGQEILTDKINAAAMAIRKVME